MKPILQKLTFALLFVSVTSFLAAQTASKGSAEISVDLVITLSDASPLVADYTFNMSGIPFKNKAAAVEFFKIIHDNLMSYTLDYDTHLATVHIAKELMDPRGWGIAEYNAYFSKTSERYLNVLAAVNE